MLVAFLTPLVTAAMVTIFQYSFYVLFMLI